MPQEPDLGELSRLLQGLAAFLQDIVGAGTWTAGQTMITFG